MFSPARRCVARNAAASTPALAAGNIGLLLGSLIAGLLGDRFGRKPVMIACVSAFGILSLVSAFVASPTQLAMVRLPTGLGLGGGIPLAIALAADFAPTIAKARFVLLASLGIPMGFALAGFASGRLIGAFGWPAVFIAGGAPPAFPAAGADAPVAGINRSPRRASDATGQSCRALPRRARAKHGAAVVHQSAQSSHDLLPSVADPRDPDDAGTGPSAAIVAATVFSLGVIASPTLMAQIIDRLGIERVLTVALAAGASCILAIGLLDPPFALLVALVFGAGIGVGAQGGINALAALIYPPSIRATGAGWALGFGRIGGVAGPLLGGALLAHGFSAPQIYAAAAVPAFGAMALMAVLGACKRSDVCMDGAPYPRNADETLGGARRSYPTRSGLISPRPAGGE